MRHWEHSGGLLVVIVLSVTRHINASEWDVYTIHSQTTCSTHSSFEYTPISVPYTYRLDCLDLCRNTESCFSVIVRNISQGFRECVLASDVSGCPPVDTIWYENVQLQSLPRTCADVQRMSGAASDGEYCLSIDGAGRTGAQIYCHNMGTATPSEYLTLPSGESENYSQTYKASCTAGSAFYSRIGLNLMEMKINSWDETFATVTISSYGSPTLGCDSYPLYGRAFSCSLNSGGPHGEFNVVLTGTGFLIPESVSWVATGNQPTMFDSLVHTSQTAYAQCSGSCGGCNPQDSTATSPPYTYYSTQHTDKVMPVAYDKTLDPSPCQIIGI